jgi:AbrB family looped-hinge helix DNA binding protein
MADMAIMKVTASGQVSIPAAIRQRWQTHRVMIVDEGDRLVLMPIDDDPISQLQGLLKGTELTSDELRARFRDEEQAAEDRRAHDPRRR